MRFPTFVADYGCVSSPPSMMTHMTRRSMISDEETKKIMPTRLLKNSITIFQIIFFVSNKSAYVVVIDLLNSFRDGNDLNLSPLNSISDAVLLVCCCTWAETTITTRRISAICVSFYQFEVLRFNRSNR